VIILGIDPGSRKTGFAVIECEGNRKSIIDFGTIFLTEAKSMPEKLVRIFNEVGSLFAKFGIASVAVEAGFYGKNAQSAYKLGYARSAAVLAAALKGVEVVEYSPRKVKQSVTGNGNASKPQVMFMVKRLLSGAERLPLREDEADACAVAICHAQNSGGGKAGYRNWKEFVAKNSHMVVKRAGVRRVK
jgi:crossover junction endodeoxyribonuclease RuvC